MDQDDPPTIHTIGHSTRPPAEFIELLQAHGVQRLVDVRTIPQSRRHPHFNAHALAVDLPNTGIEYAGLKALGGLRHPSKDFINSGWKNDSFRGYADYMQTREFEAALTELMDQAGRRTTAIMCAEAVPWHCHRSLIADALLVRGWRVLHIMGLNEVRPHALTAWARVDGTSITYPEPSLFM